MYDLCTSSTLVYTCKDLVQKTGHSVTKEDLKESETRLLEFFFK